MGMKISKRIPARTKTLHDRWCHREWMKCDAEYRRIRDSLRKGSLQTCHWCKHKFKDGEQMALAVFEEVGNKVLCQTCAAELIESDGE